MRITPIEGVLLDLLLTECDTGGFGGSMGGVAGSGKAKRPIGVKFEIPYFTTSGIQVRYLKIIEPKVSAGSPTSLNR